MKPIFDFNEVKVELLKKFDGKNNYFNCSSFDNKVIFRKEHKIEDKLLVSDVINDHNEILLEHYQDDQFYYSYEDARLIDNDNISVCVARFDVNDVTRLENVAYKKYNIRTKKFYHFLTQRAHFEKHWQFYQNYIIYHVNPYTVFNENEEEIFVKHINWNPWIKLYGNPGLSTNVFNVEGEKYILFHSYVNEGPHILKYYVGILKVDEDLQPYGYCLTPLLESNRSYTDEKLLNNLWKWRNTKYRNSVKYEVIFPMNVDVGSIYINIYAGLNDCSACILKLEKDKFIEKIKQEPFIIY